MLLLKLFQAMKIKGSDGMAKWSSQLVRKYNNEVAYGMFTELFLLVIL